MADINEYTYMRLKANFPFLVRDAKEYMQINDYEVLIYMNDGSVVSYDDFYITFRTLPNDNSDLSEDIYRRELGIRLRRIMESKGVTQVMLSDMTGISTVLLSQYMTGKTTPSFYNIDKIARALDCSTDSLRYINVFRK